MSIYGAEFVLTPRKGMNGAIEKAKRCLKNYLMPGYRFNLTIRPTLKFTKQRPQEIIKDFPDGLDYMITGWDRWSYHWLCRNPKTTLS
jgi:cysteine synthase A